MVLLFRYLFITVTVLFHAWGLSAQKNPPTSNPRPPQPSTAQPYPQYAQPPQVLEELRSDWNLGLGMTIGASQLFHKTDFERTAMLDKYKEIEYLLEEVKNFDNDYTWEEFANDYKLRSSIFQPRFGLNAVLTYGNIPAYVLGEFNTSTSGFQKMSFAAGAGLGRQLYFGNDFCLDIKGGYKIVIFDRGFGSELLVNSIGDDELRKYVSRTFGAINPVGPPRGDLLTMRVGFGKYFGPDRRTYIGIESYGELDLTNETLRISRMNTLGAQVLVQFVLF
jgi:hypothetical protein